MARPSKYRPEFAEQARKLCKLGATDHELADFFGVSVRSVAQWRVVHPEFSQALKVGKKLADDRVRDSLFRRALGYEHDETDLRVVGTKLVKTPVRKHYPPDTTACIFWLKNRQPRDWRDRHQHELTGAGGRTLAQELASMPGDGQAGPSAPGGEGDA